MYPPASLYGRLFYPDALPRISPVHIVQNTIGFYNEFCYTDRIRNSL